MNKLYLVIARVIVVISALVTIKMITSSYSTENVGLYYLILAYSSIVILIYHSPFSSYINRHINTYDINKTLISVLKFYMVFSIIFGMVLTLILVSIYILFDGAYHLSPLIFASCVFIHSLSLGLHNRLLYTLNMLGESKYFSILLILTSITSLFMSFILSQYVNSPLIWIAGSSLSFMCYTFIAFRVIVIKFIHSYSVKLNIYEVLKFVIPLFMSSLFIWWLNTGYRILVESAFNMETLGLISVALSIPIAIFSAVNTLLNQVYYPVFYKYIEHSGKSSWYTLACNVIPVLFVTCLYVIGLSDVLLFILVGDKFHHLMSLVKVGAIIECLRYIIATTCLYTHIDNTIKKIILPYTYGAIFLTICFLIPNQDSITYIPLFLLISSAIVFLSLIYRLKINIAFILFNSRMFYSLFSLFFLFIPYLFTPETMIENLIVLIISGFLYLLINFFILNKIKVSNLF